MNKYFKLSIVFASIAVLSFMSFFYTIFSTYSMVGGFENMSDQEQEQKLGNLRKINNVGMGVMVVSATCSVVSALYGYKQDKK